MTDANVKLSQSELLLVCDDQFILTKNNIINKVYLLFGMLSEVFLNEAKTNKEIFPDEVLRASPKIYKGENYKGLPYVMLDYPRYFVKNDAFSIRCFFWWGNFFSITLHLSGKYAEKYGVHIFQALLLENNLWHVCVGKDQWHHHFDQDNYLIPSKEMLSEFKQRSFQKIAKKIPLNQWDEAYDFFINNYRELVRLLKK